MTLYASNYISITNYLQILIISHEITFFFISYYAMYFISYRPPDRVTGEYGYEVTFMGQLVTAMHGTYTYSIVKRCLTEILMNSINYSCSLI